MKRDTTKVFVDVALEKVKSNTLFNILHPLRKTRGSFTSPAGVYV